MRVGIIGLPNSGKSSLFNLLTHAGAAVGIYPFTTTDRNVGVVPVQDERLPRLAQVTKPQKLTPATIRVVDIAGLVKGASQNEGLGNKFLSHIREVDLVLHLVRAFEDANIPHVYATIDPARDYDIVVYELLMADLDMVDKRLDRIKVKAEAKEERGILEHLRQNLSCGQRPNVAGLPGKLPADLPLLSTKPEIVVLNFGAGGATPVPLAGFRISVSVEAEIPDFLPEEKRTLRTELNLERDGVEGLIEDCFDRLKLIRFYTIKGDETRAWAIARGATALEAAGLIHSDLKEGFIKAEVVNVDDLINSGDFASAASKGKVRIEGREYHVKDGDVLLIKFR